MKKNEFIKAKTNSLNTHKKYLAWKRKNVTLRGVKKLGEPNKIWGSFGRGLYTAALSNKAMAKQYGKVYFVVNNNPKNPKIAKTLNRAELIRQDLIEAFCNKHGEKYNIDFFEQHTSIESEMLKLGYDGLIIPGREMVNYTPPNNILYFENEEDLKNYYLRSIEPNL